MNNFTILNQKRKLLFSIFWKTKHLIKGFVVLFFLFSTQLKGQNNALNFVGGDDHVTSPNGGGLNNLQSGTIEMWVRWTGTQDQAGTGVTVWGAVLARQSNFVFSNHVLGLNGSNPATANIIWRPYNNTNTAVTSSVIAGDGVWNHVAIVYSSGSHIMYVNGVQVGSATTTGAISDAPAIPLVIGAWIGDGDSYSTSTIDEVRIWNTTRTATEIATNMSKTLTGSESGLLTYYSFNQGVANANNAGVTTLNDLAPAGGTNNATLNNFALNGTTSNWVGGAPVPTINALRFDGIDDEVVVPDNAALQLTNTITLEGWINLNSFSNEPPMVTKGDDNGYILWVGGDGRPACRIGGGTTTIQSPSAITLNTWHHIAVTYDGTIRRMYVNGVQVATVSNSAVANTGTNPLRLGRWQSPASRLLNGQLDEVRIWNVARTCDQINALKDRELIGNEANLVAYYNFNQGTPSGTNTGIVTLVDLATGVGGANNGTLTNFGTLTGATSNWVDGSGNGVSGTTPVPQPEINVQGNSVNIVDGDVTPSTADHTGFGLVNTGNNLIRTFTIQNTGTSVLNITSITSNNAKFVVSGAPTTVAAGSSATFQVTYTPTAIITDNATITINNGDCDEAVYDFAVQGAGTPRNALHFDGTNDNVRISHNTAFNPSTNLTLEARVFRTASVYGTVISKWDDDNNHRGYMLNFGESGNNNVISFVATNNGQWNPNPILSWNTGVSTNLNQWYHIALTFQETGTNNVKLYLDGVLSAQTTWNFTIDNDNPIDVLIGGYDGPGNGQNVGANSRYFAGIIDEVRIWNTTRTCSEIQSVMNRELVGNETGLVAYYQFNQGTAGGTNTGVTTLTDIATSVGGTNNGTLNNFALTGTTSNWVDASGNGVTGTIPEVPTEINVQGNTNNITDGSTTPAATNHTDFGNVANGSNLIRTFTIQNTGGQVLNITSITSNNAKFVIGTAPTTVAAGSSATFQVTYTPTAIMTDNATITINNGDCDEAVYDFAVQGAGTPRNALNFDGSNDFVNCAHNATLDITGTLTLSAWVRTGGAGTFRNILLKGNYGYGFAIDNSNQLGYWSDSGYSNCPRFGTTTNGVWTHVAVVVVQGVSTTFYINGVQVGQSTNPLHTTINLGGASSNIFLGIQGTGCTCNYFNGDMDEVQVWNVARTCSEIQSTMNRELVGNEAGLVAYYNFNQGVAGGSNTSVTTLTDVAGANNNGTLNNFTLTGATSNWVDGTGNGVTGTTPQTRAIINVIGLSNGSTTNVGGFALSSNNTFTYTIQNTGGVSLSLTGSPRVNRTSGSTDFSVTTQPASSSILGGNSVTFVVTFTPSSLGVKTSTFTITSNDCSTPSYTFTLTGSGINATPSSVRGNMMSFNGTNQSISIANNTNLNFGTSTNFTLEAWIKYTGSATDFTGIVVKGGALSGWTGYQLVLVGNRIAGEISNGSILGVAQGLQGTTLLNDNQWHHLAMVVTRSSNNVKLYVDGKQEADVTNAIIGGNVDNTAPMRIAVERTSALFFGGNTEEVRIWNVARTQAQIRESMHLTLSGAESGLVAYYQFNETTGDAIDAISGNNGTLQNSPTRSASEVAVAGGTSDRRNVTASLVNFTNANVAVNFTTAPADEFVAYQLRGNPFNGVNALNAGTNTASSYWIIRQFGTGGVAYNGMNFVLPSSNTISSADVTLPSNLKLYKRPDNSTAAFPAFFASATSANNTTKTIQFTGFTSQTSFSQFEIGSTSSPLPVSLLGFSGKRENLDNVTLTWQTATETNNKGFEVETSENGILFSKIAFVDGAGNSNVIRNYELGIKNADDAYYRLRQVDLNGNFSYSNVIFIKGIENFVKVYPNPTDDKIKVELNVEEVALFELTNIEGKIVLKGNFYENKNELSLSKLPKGTYILKVVQKGNKSVQKIIVK